MDRPPMNPKEAIDQAASEHVRSDGDGTLVIGWTLLIATTNVDEDGDTISGITTLTDDDSMPWTTFLGILEAARIRASQQFGADK